MDDQSNKNQDRSAQDGNLGRYNNAANEQMNSHDIANVDQQEGNMKHGSTGGNFDEKKEQNTSTKKPV
jgi:hypothetical protein